MPDIIVLPDPSVEAEFLYIHFLLSVSGRFNMDIASDIFSPLLTFRSSQPPKWERDDFRISTPFGGLGPKWKKMRGGALCFAGLFVTSPTKF